MSQNLFIEIILKTGNTPDKYQVVTYNLTSIFKISNKDNVATIHMDDNDAGKTVLEETYDDLLKRLGAVQRIINTPKR